MFRRLQGRLNQLQGEANQTLGQAQVLIDLMKALVEDINDGVGLTIVVDDGAVTKLVEMMTDNKGGDLPVRLRIDPGVDTPKEA